MNNDPKKSPCCGGEETHEPASCCGSVKTEGESCCSGGDKTEGDSCCSGSEKAESESCCSSAAAAEEKSCCASAEPVVVESGCCASASAPAARTVEVSSCCGGSAAMTAPVVSSCCGGSSPAQAAGADSCCAPKQKTDWLLWGCGSAVVFGYLGFLLSGHQADASLPWLSTMMHTAFEMVNAMWWGVISAAFFVGLLGRIPRELVMSVLGKGGSKRGVFRATLAGLLLDLCNHGILMVAMKLYERGASIGQVMAFLIASPWNSLTLTLILIGLIGLKWTLLFILGSLVIAWISGLIFDRLVVNGTLPANPNQVADGEVAFMPTLKAVWRDQDWRLPALLGMFWQGLKESKMVLRWVFFGVVLVALVRAFVPPESFGVWFGASVGGLLLTLLATTLIEVCSEGSSPIAADLVTRAAAPGNAFTFLMAGASTDYTEIMALQNTTRSWKIALFLPLVTVPQVLLIGWLMNVAGV